MSVIDRPHALIWIAILTGMTLLGVIALSPAAFEAWRTSVPMPFTQTSYQILFAAALAAHVGEGALAHRLAAASSEAPRARAWALQTLLLGYPSLRLLRRRLAEVR